MLFQDALKDRLDLIKPSSQEIKDCMTKYPFQFTPKIKDVIQKLHQRGTYVYLVSGGFRQMINPLAEQLQIPQNRIFANNILFDKDGQYMGFDTSELTSR